jgi:hypothetical protein
LRAGSALRLTNDLDQRSLAGEQSPGIEEAAMSTDSRRDYHIRRAREELDLAYRAEGFSAMSAHMRLSAIHMAEATRPAIAAATAARA